ncbi:MAG: hypothetical protein PHG49_02245 [Candidatus Pacebacteria bacterium]|nr:hypothetical protein [Candidatus Paceibacterota bacterium]
MKITTSSLDYILIDSFYLLGLSGTTVLDGSSFGDLWPYPHPD